MLSKLAILAYVVVSSLALILMKLGSSSHAPIEMAGGKLSLNLNPHFIVGTLLYIVSFVLYAFLIAKYDLGYIVPLMTALIYVVIFVASFILFKEVFTLWKIIGIALIVIGAILINIKQ